MKHCVHTYVAVERRRLWGDVPWAAMFDGLSGCSLPCPPQLFGKRKVNLARFNTNSVTHKQPSSSQLSERKPIMSDSSVVFWSVCHVVSWHVSRLFKSPWYDSLLASRLSRVTSLLITLHVLQCAEGITTNSSKQKEKKYPFSCSVIISCFKCFPWGINHIFLCVSFIFGNTDCPRRTACLNINTSLF